MDIGKTWNTLSKNQKFLWNSFLAFIALTGILLMPGSEYNFLPIPSIALTTLLSSVFIVIQRKKVESQSSFLKVIFSLTAIVFMFVVFASYTAGTYTAVIILMFRDARMIEIFSLIYIVGMLVTLFLMLDHLKSKLNSISNLTAGFLLEVCGVFGKKDFVKKNAHLHLYFLETFQLTLAYVFCSIFISSSSSLLKDVLDMLRLLRYID